MRSDLRAVGRVALLAAALALAVDAALWIQHLLQVPAPAEARHVVRGGIVGAGLPYWAASLVNEIAVLLICAVAGAVAWKLPADRTARLLALAALAYLLSGLRVSYGAWPGGSLRTLQASGSALLAGAATLPSWLFLAAALRFAVRYRAGAGGEDSAAGAASASDGAAADPLGRWARTPGAVWGAAAALWLLYGPVATGIVGWAADHPVPLLLSAGGLVFAAAAVRSLVGGYRAAGPGRRRRDVPVVAGLLAALVLGVVVRELLAVAGALWGEPIAVAGLWGYARFAATISLAAGLTAGVFGRGAVSRELQPGGDLSQPDPGPG